MGNQNATTHASGHGEGGHFIVPFKVLLNVCFALLALTVLTVATAQMHLGPIAGLVAFSIAFVKAMLVMMYFMGLKYDVKGNQLIFGLGFFFLGVLFLFSVLDIYTRIAETSTL
jgi:cytochrome c oxidase subunit 4